MVQEKSFSTYLLIRIHSELLKKQKPEQSGFTLGKSISEHILPLYLMVEHLPEFRQEMLAAFVDLKTPFDIVH